MECGVKPDQYQQKHDGRELAAHAATDKKTRPADARHYRDLLHRCIVTIIREKSKFRNACLSRIPLLLFADLHSFCPLENSRERHNHRSDYIEPDMNAHASISSL